MLRLKDEDGNVINGLYRDNVGAIIIDNIDEYEKYMREKQRTEQINNLSNDLEKLKTDMSDIRSLLVEFINKANK